MDVRKQRARGWRCSEQVGADGMAGGRLLQG